MEQDVSTLQPTAHPLVTYRSKGLSKSVEIPEFRFKTSSTDADIWGPERGLTRLMEGACMGLMDNSTALALLKVCSHCACTLTAFCHRTAQLCLSMPLVSLLSTGRRLCWEFCHFDSLSVPFCYLPLAFMVPAAGRLSKQTSCSPRCSISARLCWRTIWMWPGSTVGHVRPLNPISHRSGPRATGASSSQIHSATSRSTYQALKPNTW